MNRSSKFQTLVALAFIGFSASSIKADQVFLANTNIPGTGNVNASATFHQSGPNLLQITLVNNSVTSNVGQGISGVQFQIFSGGIVFNVTGTITGQSNPLIRVADGGAVTSLGTLTTGWGLQSAGPSFNLTALGFTGNGTNPPDELILGPLSSPNGSIAGNTPHNPFINQTGVFTLTLSQNLPANFQITNVVFLFGTGPTSVNGTPGGPGTPIPEPATILLFGSGLITSFLRRPRKL